MQGVSLCRTCPILALQFGSRQRFAWPNRQIGGRSLGDRMVAFSANKGSLSHRETIFCDVSKKPAICAFTSKTASFGSQSRYQGRETH
jgi:hypothetical protein